MSLLEDILGVELERGRPAAFMQSIKRGLDFVELGRPGTVMAGEFQSLCCGGLGGGEGFAFVGFGVGGLCWDRRECTLAVHVLERWCCGREAGVGCCSRR